MPLESGFEKWTCNGIGVMGQQLRLYAMNPRRLLQSRDDMGEQANLDLARVGETIAVGDIEIANHALAAFVDEKRVAEDAASIDGGVARQNFGVYVAQDHVSRTGAIPGKQASPELGLIVEQRTQVDGRKMPEIENFQTGSWCGSRAAAGVAAEIRV